MTLYSLIATPLMWEWQAWVLTLTLLRVGVGLFFALSGWHKLVNAQRHASLVATLKADGIPWVRFNQWWVPACEFFGGLALTLGFVTMGASVVLLVLIFVACLRDGPSRVAAFAPIDRGDRIDDWLYLPEVLYALVLALFVTMGGGPWSLDAIALNLW